MTAIEWIVEQAHCFGADHRDKMRSAINSLKAARHALLLDARIRGVSDHRPLVEVVEVVRELFDEVHWCEHMLQNALVLTRAEEWGFEDDTDDDDEDYEWADFWSALHDAPYIFIG